MKYICILIYSISILALSHDCVRAAGNVDYQSLRGKKIVLDPGHGGGDSGAVRFDERESELNLSVAKCLERYLSLLGASVTMTRNSDSETVSLNTRFDTAEASAADLFISLHHNDAGDSFYKKEKFHNVSEVYYGLINNDGYKNELLGMAFARAFESLYGVGRVKLKPGYFRVIRSRIIPSLLMEPFYMGDARLLRIYGDAFYRRHEAMTYLKAIAGYFEIVNNSAGKGPARNVNELSDETFEITLGAGDKTGGFDLLASLLNASGHKAVVCSDDFLSGLHVSDYYVDKLKFVASRLEGDMIGDYIEAIRSNSCAAKIHLSAGFDEKKPCALYHYYRSENGKKLAAKLAQRLSAATRIGFEIIPDSFYILSSTQAVTVALNLNPRKFRLNDGPAKFMVNFAAFKALCDFLADAEKK